MAYDGRYDHPRYITAFLNGQRLTLEELAQDLHVSRPKIDEDKLDDLELPASSNKLTGSTTPGFVSAASSPPVGTRAPPPTPETTVVTSVNAEHLPSIDEDPDTSSTDAIPVPQRSGDSKQFRPTANPFQPIGKDELKASLATSPEEILHISDSSTISTLKRQVQGYQEDVVRKFTEQTQARIALGNITNRTNKDKGQIEANKITKSTTAAESPNSDDYVEIQMNADTAIDGNVNNSSSASNGTFPDTQDESTAISERSEDDDSSVNIIVDAPKSPDSFKVEKSTVVMSSPDKMCEEIKEEDISTLDVPVSEASIPKQSQVAIKEESREHATFFPTWGAPAARDTQPARIRRVILENIPLSADLNFVQSLIHGGAIEVMTLGKAPSGTACAYVTFTEADACDRYYEAYPNGLEYKHRGKKYVTFVHKGDKVDVVSGLMISYLECGATRVVKVVNADEDWSLRALHRIAEGPNSNRKIEAVVDTYSNDMRNITFRFTNISDAVTFRGQLLRDTEWQDADIQFISDPCEKATGIHWS